jgi:hypothetical protein
VLLSQFGYLKEAKYKEVLTGELILAENHGVARIQYQMNHPKP